MLKSFLTNLEDAGVEYVLVGDDRRLPIVDGDVDLVVTDDALSEVLADARFWNRPEYRLIQSIRHEARAISFVLAVSNSIGTVPDLLPIDVCTDYMRDARLIMQASELLADRRQRSTPDRSLTYWVPSPAAALSYYLLKKSLKGGLNETAFEYLVQTYSTLTRPPDLERHFGPVLANRAIEALRTADCRMMQDLIEPLGDSVRRRAAPSVAALVRDYWRLLQRMVAHTGLQVQIRGDDPDTLEEIGHEVAEHVHRAFRRTRVLRPSPCVAAHSMSWSQSLVWLATSTLVITLIDVSTEVGRTHRRFPSTSTVSVQLRGGPLGPEVVPGIVADIVDHLATREASRLRRASH